MAIQSRRGARRHLIPAIAVLLAGAGLAAVATGAAIGAAAGSVTGYPSASGAGYSAGQPCANTVVAPDTGVTYYNCGSAWYTRAYSPGGPVFIAVNRPPGL